MRALAEATAKYLGQQVIVENKPGAAGTSGRRGDAERQAGRLHADPDPDQRLSAAAHREDAVRPARRSHLHPRRLRLHVRRRRAIRGAVEDLAGVRRVREGEPGQDLLRHAGREHQPPHHDGRDRVQAGHQVVARAAQGQRAEHGRAARRAHRLRRRRDRLGPARERREDAAARDLGREAHQALARRADAQGARLSTSSRTPRTASRGPEGHGPAAREDAPRRLQEGHGGPDPPRDAREVRPGPLVSLDRGLHALRARDLRRREGDDGPDEGSSRSRRTPAADGRGHDAGQLLHLGPREFQLVAPTRGSPPTSSRRRRCLPPRASSGARARGRRRASPGRRPRRAARRDTIR